MKNKFALSICFVAAVALSFTGCDFLGSIGKKDDAKTYDKELPSSSGKWYFLDGEKNPTDTYFSFNGEEGNMTFVYYEGGEKVSDGGYRVVYKGNGSESTYTFSWCLKRDGEEKEDVVICYADDFETDFTQFTVMQEEKNIGFVDARPRTHVYRISELPYKMGTYVKEGEKFKTEKDDYKYAEKYCIPNGVYVSSTGESMTFFATKPRTYHLFSYRNGEETIEGVYTVATDKKTIYLYIEHDPFDRITKDDEKNYDTTFSKDYPPDFYLRGDFAVSANDREIKIDGLYHHTYSPTKIEDSVWVFGTYVAR